ncbi:hypothetical protein AMJ87_01495 [candidate division WOR_3 bacterium SM23_60]|uniref:DUF3795 domain-containing protein n=1 Tax=candidate division WOR_3 bacterium SM23_60 TaxID=1703780 RepID=A0A0S8GKN8_UNCW3|nr:MAG: hypothetical protein AMJ87_01495 [candidate division WOR_3 bacterium SM23_60]
MSKTIYAKCGFVCSSCAAYKDNVKNKKQRQRGSEAWKKFYGFKLKPENMYCDGCQVPDEKNKSKLMKYMRTCPIRVCAFKNKIKTCAHCSEYRQCMYNLVIFYSGVDRKSVEKRVGALISDRDYHDFVEPFENHKHLRKIRSSIKKKDIKKPAPVEVKPKVTPFPEKLRGSKKQMAAYKKLHTVLAKIAAMTGKTYGQEAVLKKRRERLFKMLWTFGCYGQFKKKPRAHLYLDGSTYLNQKITGHYGTVINYCKTLKTFGVNCKIIPRIKKGWLTPMGWLRSKSKREKQAPWYMTISFGQKAGGTVGVKFLKTNVTKLKKKHGKRGIRYLMNARMI